MPRQGHPIVENSDVIVAGIAVLGTGVSQPTIRYFMVVVSSETGVLFLPPAAAAAAAAAAIAARSTRHR